MEKQYFGVMLDMSRNAVMKPEQVKKFAKVISSFGYNMIQLYTEDTYEVEGEPYFGYMRGRYTQAEIRDIVEYCETLGIEVVPCIQTLAHLNQMFRWGNVYSRINDFGDILLVEEERTMELIENMFKSIRACYKTNLVHIGMDEAHMLGLGKYLDKHGYHNRFDILLNHLKKVIEIAKKYGFEPMMWSDMFFRLANGGNYYPKECHVPEEVKQQTPNEVGLVYWDYYHSDEKYFTKMMKAHQSFGNPVWFAGGAWTWMGFAPKNQHSLNTMKPAMLACRKTGVSNIMLTMWGDNGKECSFYSVLPSLFAIRKFYEGEKRMSVIKEEFKKVTGESFDAMMALDLPNFVGGNKTGSGNVCKYALYSDPFFGFTDSATVEGCDVEYKNLSRRLSLLGKKSAYGYIFDSMSKLCAVLALKYDLGYKTRKAYQAGDKETLKALLENYKLAEKKVETFYQAFRTLWYTENKACGFEVQEQRLGGLKLRLRSCYDRLNDYLSGKIDSIPELEEKLLDYYGKGEEFTEGAIGFNVWSTNVSANIV